ncbi:hypothetical protein ACLOAV_006811 [Pseudogymnoascus australis]
MSDANLLASFNPLQSPPKRAHKAEGTYVKRGTSRQVHREVEAMEFVRRHTSIPIPSVFEIHFTENDASPSRSSWFSMSVVPGSSPTDAWPNMDDEARRATEADLRNYLHELRTMPPPTPAYIGSCSGGLAYDHRLNNGFLVDPSLQYRIFTIFLWSWWRTLLGHVLDPYDRELRIEEDLQQF